MDDLKPHDDTVESSSDRSFGFLWAIVFLIVAVWPIMPGTGGSIRYWAVSAAGCFFAVALAQPVLLAPFNRAWMRLAKLLSRIVTPIVMGVIFFGVVWPVGVLRRLSGADPLRRRARQAADSYWIKRSVASDNASTMKTQF